MILSSAKAQELGATAANKTKEAATVVGSVQAERRCRQGWNQSGAPDKERRADGALIVGHKAPALKLIRLC
jgi:hypothetical protein